MAPPLPVPSRTRLDLASADPLLFSNARDWLRRRGKVCAVAENTTHNSGEGWRQQALVL